MSPDLDAILCERYPGIFDSASVIDGKLAWHFECQDGWFQIIDALCALITSHRLKKGTQPVKAHRVREKFGTLRFDYAGGDSYVDGLVDMAATISGQICELCGQKGEIAESLGWLSTRCPEHTEVCASVLPTTHNSF